MKHLLAIAIWVVMSWSPEPDAHFAVEAYASKDQTWHRLSYGATTSVRLSLPENMGLIMLRLVIIGRNKSERISYDFAIQID